MRMTWWSGTFLNRELSRPTSVLGLHLWVVIAVCVGASIVLALFLLPLCFSSRCRRRRPPLPSSRPPSTKPLKLLLHDPTPPISKEIVEIVHRRPDPPTAATGAAAMRVVEDAGKREHRVALPTPPSASTTTGTATTSGESRSTELASAGTSGGCLPEVSHLGWGHWYTLRELEEATGGLAEENVVGEGGYGIVYRGVLADGTTIAIKNLLNKWAGEL